MLRAFHLIPRVVLPFLVLACNDESLSLSGPQAEPPSQAASRGTPVAMSRFQVRRVGASAAFFSVDPTGCVRTDVAVFASEQSWKRRRGKPEITPLATLIVDRVDSCTDEVLIRFFGTAEEADFQAVPGNLATARLQAAITGTDFVTGTGMQVEVDLAWVGMGDLESTSEKNQFRQSGSLIRYWLTGTSRQATALGTVSLGGENLAPEPAFFAHIFRTRFGELSVGRTQEVRTERQGR